MVVSILGAKIYDDCLVDCNVGELTDPRVEGHSALENSRVVSGFRNQLLMCHGDDSKVAERQNSPTAAGDGHDQRMKGPKAPAHRNRSAWRQFGGVILLGGIVSSLKFLLVILHRSRSRQNGDSQKDA